jgi:hypothetical protein
MFKKSLIIGSITLVLLVLFALAGCSNPTDGSTGSPGGPAPLTLQGVIAADALDQHFTNNDVIRLISGTGGPATTVTGIVPAGKILEIAGNVAMPAGLILRGGTVSILEDGVLDARGAGFEENSTGALIIDGDLVLNYVYAEGMFGEAWPAGVSFGPNGAINLDDEGTDARVDYLFSMNVPAVVTSVTTQLGGTKPDIDNWVGGRRLILADPIGGGPGTVTTSYDVDLTGKGILVIRNTLIMDEDTNQYQHTLRSSGGGSIVIAKTGTLALNQSVLPTNIPITVKGFLTTNGGITTQTIPANVDLSAATLTSAVGTSTLVFGPRGVAVATIDLTNNPLVIAGETVNNNSSIVNLSINTITNSLAAGASSLTLPAGAAAVDRIITTAQIININGNQYTTLSPRSISGAGRAQLTGVDMVLAGDIELTTAAILGLASNKNLGSNNTAQLAQLARIIGGEVDAGALHFDLDQGTYYTSLTTTGDFNVSGAVSFNAPSAIITVHSIYAEDGPAVINGRSPIVLTGDLVAANNITVNTTGGLTLATDSINTIADGASIIVGPGSEVVAGGNLLLEEGAYTASGLVTITPAALTGTITTINEAGKGLTIAPTLGDTVNGITLFADGAAIGTFTAVGGAVNTVPVVLSGSGILIPAAVTGATLTVSGTTPGGAGTVIVKGSSTITLEAHATPANKGSLILIDGAKLGAGDTAAYTANHGGTNDYNTPAAYDTGNKLWAIGTATPDKVALTTNSTEVDGVFASTTVKQ